MAAVEYKGEVAAVHVPNSGRLKELLTEGATVFLRPAPGKGRKTFADLVLVEQVQKHRKVLVCIESGMAGNLFREALEEPGLLGLGPARLKQAEVKFLRSRLDFLLESRGGREIFVEVKSVTLVQGSTALFPDAPTARGRKHLEDLMQAPALGYGAAAVFVVQREDAACFRPNEGTDPLFAERVRQAARRGVKMAAFACRVEEEGIFPKRRIPVIL